VRHLQRSCTSLARSGEGALGAPAVQELARMDGEPSPLRVRAHLSPLLQPLAGARGPVAVVRPPWLGGRGQVAVGMQPMAGGRG